MVKNCDLGLENAALGLRPWAAFSRPRSQFFTTVEPLHADTFLIRTPLYYGQFPMYRQNSHTFLLKKTSIIRTLSNTDNGHLISAPGGTDTPGTMCQINIVGDVPFPVGNYSNIDQSVKWGWQACTTSTVRGICSFAVFCSVSRPYCSFTFDYERHFVLCCKEKLEPLIRSCFGIF